MMRPPLRIETKRLLLRRPVPEDARPIFTEYAADDNVTRYLTWKPHRTIAETKSFIKRCTQAWKEGAAFPWAVVRKTDNQLIGMIEIVNTDISGAMVGFVLAQRFWGNNYIPEALSAVADWILDNTGIFRVWAVCDCENTASARAMEKAGLQREGILRRWTRLPAFDDIPRDCFCYARIK